MGRFVLVESALWQDEDFMDLSPAGKLVFLWAWTNPYATICGLYECSRRRIVRGAGLRLAEVNEALAELDRKPLVKYDLDNEVIWVVNRARYANRSPKTAAAMQREVRDCPPSPLLEEFVARYGRQLSIRLGDE